MATALMAVLGLQVMLAARVVMGLLVATVIQAARLLF